jgi:hypothetical protein
MKMWLIPAFASFFGACAFAQQAPHPELRLEMLVLKRGYRVNEKLIVKAKLTNLTSKTLCFPVPDLECSTPQTGSVVIDGEPVRAGEGERHVCHVDGRGPVGIELDADVNDHWIKLSPNAVYRTNATEVKVTLSEAGDWRLTASYYSPEGSFGPEYRKTLVSAAKKAGCQLPESSVIAEPKLISVRPD